MLYYEMVASERNSSTVPYCPKCREEFQDWVKVCPDCGVALVDKLPAEKLPAEKPPAKKPPAKKPPAKKPPVEKPPVPPNCGNCGAEVPEGDAFCGECGAPVSGEVVRSCPSCGADMRLGTKFCGQCGASTTGDTVTGSPDADRALPSRLATHGHSVQNTSGQGAIAAIPPEIQGWNWGAFTLNWIWGLCNNVWIALLCLIPFIGVVMVFVLGARGNEWAWQSRKWDSIERFKETQSYWSYFGILTWLALGIFAAWIIISSSS